MCFKYNIHRLSASVSRKIHTVQTSPDIANNIYSNLLFHIFVLICSLTWRQTHINLSFSFSLYSSINKQMFYKTWIVTCCWLLVFVLHCVNVTCYATNFEKYPIELKYELVEAVMMVADLICEANTLNWISVQVQSNQKLYFFNLPYSCIHHSSVHIFMHM